MSFLLRIFKKKNDEDYETILSSLALNIQKRQVQLSEIRLRERRSSLLVTLYTLAAWAAYVSLWYVKALPNFSGHQRSSKVEKAVKALPVVIGPVVILFVRRIVQIWYKRKGDAEEKTLQGLLKQQRSKVEEIKKKTNYYSTRDLLQRYDEGPAPGTPLRAVPGLAPPSTPQRQQRPQNGETLPKTPVSASLKGQLSPTPSPFPTAPPRKQWYDKVADALLGDDDQTPSAATSRYALICEKCFAHNGLVKESVWEDAQYVCPKCNHFNPSVRSKKQRSSVSPVISPVASPSAPVSQLPRKGPPEIQNASAEPVHASPGAEVNMMEVDS